MANATRVVMSSRKGGAGKTVVTVLLAHELAREQRRVLVLDLDPQSVGTSMRLGADISSPLSYTALDLVRGTRGREFKPQVMVPGKLDLVAGNQRDLSALEVELSQMYAESRLTMGPNPPRWILDARLARIEGAYDFVLIDTPTGFGEITTNALEAAHLVLSPIDMASADNVESVRDLEEHVAELSRKPAVYYVPNKASVRETQWQAAVRRASELCQSRLLLASTLPASTAVPQAMSAHRDVAASSSNTATLLKEAVWKLGQFVLSQGPELRAAGGAA